MNKTKFIDQCLKFLLFFGILALYIHTMPPVFKNNDSPETTVAAYTLGIGHPPGYPLYAMAAKIFTLVPLANPSFRVNMFAVLLSMLVLVMTYIISMRTLQLFNGPEQAGSGVIFKNSLVSAFTCAVLAVSFIFWNQALDAKGGIYILNLFFLAAIIFISMILLDRFHVKYIYLLSFCFGLALTNHWPSTIILAPAAAYFFVIYFKRLKALRCFYVVIFFLAGISAYLYLPIRAHNVPALNWGNPVGFKDMMWVILRKGYIYPIKASFGLYLTQLQEFFRLFAVNYSLFSVVAAIGGYALYKKSKKHLYFLTAIFAAVVLAVVFYNRTTKELIYLMDIFLMPAEYIVLLLLGPGILFISGCLKNKNAVYLAASVFVVTLIFLAFTDYKKNNSRFDYISYDYGNNLLAGIPEGSVYLASGDYNAMPVYYVRKIEKKRGDIRFATDSFLIFKWGIDDFIKQTGSDASLEPYKRDSNIRNIISSYSSRAGIYRNYFWENPVQLDPSKFAEQQYGILMKINVVKEKTAPEIFNLYNYRGIFERSALNNDANRSLVTWYPVCMVNAANALMEENRYLESTVLNKMALQFPVNKPEGNILYNIAFAYNKLGDNAGEMQHLSRAVDKGSDITAVYERLGLLYYNYGLLDKALPIFNEALKRGSKADYVAKGKTVIEGFGKQERLEIALIKANEKLIANDIIAAHQIYDFLLEKHYKNDIIYKNLGVYHFKTGDYETALKQFLLSENETNAPGTSFYIAYAYEKLGNHEKALKELTEAIKRYPDDKGLKDLFKAIKESQDNGKGTHSSHGPR